MNTENKTCVIIGCHPSTVYRSEVLIDCIERFKKLGHPVFVASHVKPALEVDCSSYLHIKKANPITPEEILEIQTRNSLHNFFIFGNLTYISHCNIFEQEPSYHFDALENVLVAMKFAREIGYTHAIVSDGDNLLSDEDLQKLEKQIPTDKKAMFYRTHKLKLNAFSSLLYYSEINFFLENMMHDSKESYLKRSKEIGEYVLEKHYSSVFDNDSVKTIDVNENNLIDIFTTSNMDSLCSTSYKGEFNLCVLGEDVILFGHGGIGGIRVFHDGEMLFEKTLYPKEAGHWALCKVETLHWKFPIVVEYTCNSRRRKVEFTQERWEKYLSLNFIVQEYDR